MFCWTLRTSLVGRWGLAGLVCLALIGGAAISPAIPLLGESETTSISLRVPELPLAALATTSPVRFEKQAHSIRLGVYKPDRSGRVASAERGRVLLQRPTRRPSYPGLARRVLPTRHLTLRTPNESGEPFLASSSLS
jgi:hypothetical protein